jgi:hypothetical protein
MIQTRHTVMEDGNCRYCGQEAVEPGPCPWEDAARQGERDRIAYAEQRSATRAEFKAKAPSLSRAKIREDKPVDISKVGETGVAKNRRAESVLEAIMRRDD